MNFLSRFGSSLFLICIAASVHAQDNYEIGAKATYAFLPYGWKIFKRATVTLDVSRIHFNYTDFRNIKYYGVPQYPPGTEPLYFFNATVGQIYISMFF